MPLYNFFSKLGAINYNNEIVTNIVTNIRLREKITNLNVTFYPYVIKEDERPDNIAYHYYEDERYAWIVLLSNYIIDPYYQWPLSVNNFNKFITKKYGSIEESKRRIYFYRNNWYNDETILTLSAYEALPANLKKYWSPILSYNSVVTSYERKKDETSIDTNRIVEISTSSVTGFTIGDIIKQKTSGVVSASGEIKAIKSTSVVVNNITGDFSTTTGSVGSLLNYEENVSRSVSGVSVLNTSLPVSELVYWEPVSYFDYENEQNESRKTIKLIDRQYVPIIEEQIIEVLA